MANDKEETREEKYLRQTTEQFAELGRFVQAFELMVNVARRGCIAFTSTLKNQELLLRAFHHKALTALPIFDIYRAMVTFIVTEGDQSPDAAEAKITLEILAQMSTRYGGIVSDRNRLLHATWLIGWHSSSDTDFSELNLASFKWDTKGKPEPGPVENTAELAALAEQCEEVEHLLQSLTTCIVMGPEGAHVQANFVRNEKGRWATTIIKG